MREKLAGLLVAATLTTLAPTLHVHAQETRVYPDVLTEVKHDRSAPIRDHAVPPQASWSHATPWLHRPGQSGPGGVDSARQVSYGKQVGTTGALSPSGLGLNFTGPQGTFQTGAVPSDTNAAVGLTQVVQWVNFSFAVFNKATGAVLEGPLAGNSLWSGFGGQCEANNDGDPMVQYDKAANRWVMAQPVYSSPYTYCIAVSTTSDATGSYNRYAFTMPDFSDYPKLGVWPDAYYGSFNLFDPTGVTFLGAYACAFDRNAMLNGQTATVQCFNTTSEFSFLPSDLDGSTQPPAGSPDYFVDLGPSNNSLHLYRFHVDFADSTKSTFTGPYSMAVAAFTEACSGHGFSCIPQPMVPPNLTQLDSLGDRLMYRLAYRNFGDHEALVATHSVDVTGTGLGTSGIRWYEIRNPGGSPTLYQQGTFAQDSNYRWMPSIAMDKAGDIAVGYSVSSSSLYASIRYTGRIPNDPLGSLESETSILQGAGTQIGESRWGDYTSMAIDPSDDCTFWYTNQYQPSNGLANWQTQIASFKFPSCGAAPAPDFSLTPTTSTQTVTQGNVANYTLDVTPLNGFTGSVNFSVGTLPLGVTASFNPTSSPSSTVLSLTAASTAPPGAYTVAVTGTSGALTHSVNLTLVINPDPSFAVSAAPGSISVKRGSTGSYTVTVTGTGGFAGAVTLSVAGLPRHVSGGFSPASVAGSGMSTLVLSVAKGASAGTYHLTITGSSGGVSHSASVNLTAD